MSSSRRAKYVLAAGVLAGALGVASLTSPAEAEVEVCESTVYEGCPQRWDYLFAED